MLMMPHAASRTASHTTSTLPEIAAPAATTTLNSTRPDLAKTQTPANSTDKQLPNSFAGQSHQCSSP
ncbi:hypothetical protein PtA15_15A301 [Puccinia triticina]|uniref:Uncharacterized protein n=1 Tax=Puccinia triticina TaxID=208348 RepID=A0ABY7D469_9BASI|nr:uncharacterized protein PtA15_15A301 [Puccinia triticina]WAQ91908.1 hypothetical protein PtA15_15A301 [Puccinia triticina]